MKIKQLLNNFFFVGIRKATTRSIIISLVISSLCSSIVSVIAWFYLKSRKEVYTDIIIGHITWIDFYKSSDYFLIFSFLTLFVVLFVTLLPLFGKYSKYNGELNHQAYNTNEFDIILGIVLAGLIYSTSIWFFVGKITLFGFLGTAYLSVVILFFSNKFIKDSSHQLRDYYSTSLLVSCFIAIFLYLAGNAVVILIKRILPLSFLNHPKKAIWIVLIVLVIGISTFIYYSFIKKCKINFMYKISYLIQVFTPLLFLIVLNDVYQQGSKIVEMNIPLYTKCLVWMITLVAMGYIVYKFIRVNELEIKLNKLILWPTVLASSCFISYRTPAYSSFLRDDFHFGEIIIPWQQIVQFKLDSYSEFVSVQGLLGLLHGGVNNILFEGTSSSFPQASMFINVLFAIITTWLVCRIFGNKWGLLFSFFSYPVIDRGTLLIPVILILMNKKLIHNPIRWLLVWGWLSLVHCFYSPNFGPVQTLATLPFAIFMLFKFFSTKQHTKLWSEKRLLTTFILTFHFIIIVLLIPYMIGLIQFLLDNSGTNTLAYGISMFEGRITPSWFPGWFDSEVVTWIVWQGIRIGPIILCFILLFFMLIRSHSEDKKNCEHYHNMFKINFLCISGMLLIILLIPYSFGRIDIGGLSRPGILSLLSFGTLLLFPLILNKKLFNKNIFIMLIAVILGYKAGFSFYEFEKLPYRAIETIKVPLTATFVDGSKLGLPNIGATFIEPDKLKEIKDFKKLIDNLLKDDETYVDLTNRSALYYYINKSVPSLYSADYVAANYSIQSKMIDLLEKNSPPVAFIGPSIRFDGGPTSLRSYRVYKWFMDRDYVYYESEGFQFLVRADRINELGIKEKVDFDNNTINLSRIFHKNDLKKIPIAWGRSFDQMKGRFEVRNVSLEQGLKDVKTHHLRTNSDGWNEAIDKDPHKVWFLENQIAGNDADFVLIEIELSEQNKKNIKGQLFFATAEVFSEEKSFKFDVTGGKLLIPLGSSPYWLKSDRITKLRLDIDGLGMTKFKVKSLQMYKLVK